MTPQEQINHMEGEQNRLKEIMSQSDRAALHFIKISDAFKAAYPEIAAAYAAAFREESEKEKEIVDEKQEWCFHIGEWRNAGDIVPYNGDKYEVLQGHHLSQEWEPDKTPALYKLKPSGEWPEWIQPTGAQDAYAKGDRVNHKDKHWISEADSNVWEPGVYGWIEVN